MTRNRVFYSVLLATGALLIAACASQPTGSLDEKYFQREANHYLKFQQEGQTVYCQNESNIASLIPYKWCISESALRQRVENFRRDRNPVQRGGYVAPPSPGIG
jgi:outer membrane biogenesis lipoprotein LolB